MAGILHVEFVPGSTARPNAKDPSPLPSSWRRKKSRTVLGKGGVLVDEFIHLLDSLFNLWRRHGERLLSLLAKTLNRVVVVVKNKAIAVVLS